MYFLAFKKFYSLERIQNIEYKIIEFKNNYVLIQLLIDRHITGRVNIFWHVNLQFESRFQCWFIETREHLSSSDWFHVRGGQPSVIQIIFN